MKFLCPSCKAKYQIADEKVIGRAVKMKCRQCGHLIEISEALMERASVPGPALSVPPSALPPPAITPGTAAGGASLKGAPAPSVTGGRGVTPATASIPRPAPPKPARGDGAVENTVSGRTSLPRPAPAPAPSSTAPKVPARPPSSSGLGGPLGGGGRVVTGGVPRPDRVTTGTGLAPTLEPKPTSPQRGHLPGLIEREHKSQPQTSLAAEHKSQPQTSLAAEHKSQPNTSSVGGRADLPRVAAFAAPADKTTRVESSKGVRDASHPSTRADAAPLRESNAARAGLDTENKSGSQSKSGASPSPKVNPLAGAFAKAVEQAPADVVEHPLAGDEWYVGVAEEPIGPIRLTEIRDRAAKGEISTECLVWRDGFEDWRPLTAFPELVAVVEEGIASARSMVPPPGTGPVVEPFADAHSPDVRRTDAGAVAALSDRREPAGPTPTGRGDSAAKLAIAGAAVGPAAGVAQPTEHEPIEIAGLSQPRIPLAAWAAVAMALLLGVTIGIVVIKPDPPKPIIKYVEVPAKPAQPQSASPEPAASGAAEDPSEVAQNGVREGKGTPGSNGRVTQGTAKSTEPAPMASVGANQGLKGLSGLRGLGPQGGPSSEGASASSGGAQLDSATLTKTVSRYTPSVKRSCWQPALDMRSPDAPTTARVTATITVGANGRVQNVTTSGDPKGYRGLASCIQQRVRTWEFPPSGGTTEFNVPFVFAAQ